MPESSTLSKLLLLLAAASLLLLFCILFVDVVFPLEAEGTLTYTRILGEPISQITVYLPVSRGENIFKVSELEALSPRGLWTATPGPTGGDEYPDYWILTGPPIKPGESLQIRFVAEHIRDIDYEAYPWKIVADVETEAPVTVYKGYMVTVVATVEAYRIPLTIGLAGLTVGLTAAAVLTARKPQPPVAFYKPPEETGVVYQEKPEEPGGCKEWRYVCLRFFVVDKCGGSGEDPRSKDGLLRDARYHGRRGLGELSKNSVDKIIRLIEDANRIWAKCCVKLVPCLDSRGEPVFKALDPRRFTPLHLTEHKDYFVRKVWLMARVSYRIDLCSLLEGRRLVGCYGFKKSRVRVRLTWSDRGVRVDDPDYQPGVEVGVKEYKKWVEDKVKSYEEEWTGEKKRRLEEKAVGMGVDPQGMFKLIEEIKESLGKRREELEKLDKRRRELEKKLEEKPEKKLEEELEKLRVERGIEVEQPVSLFQVFKKIVDEVYGEQCIDVFVFEDYEDKWYKAGEAGLAEMPGRGIFLDEDVVEKCEGHVLAHEVGHNLGLPHHKDEDNVMHAPSKEDSTLTREQCVEAVKHLEGKTASPREVKRYLDMERKAEEKVEKQLKPEEAEAPPARGKPKKEERKPGEAEKTIGKTEKLEERIKKLEEEIRAKENLLKRNYIPNMRRRLKEEFEVEEERVEGDDIEKWSWPDDWEGDEQLSGMREGYYRLKKEIEELRGRLEKLKAEQDFRK